MDGQGQTRKYKKSEKVVAFEKMIKSGVDKHEAQRLAGVSVSHLYKTIPKLTGENRHSLKSPEMVKLAHGNIRAILKDKSAKPSDKLQAAKMIFDRAQPINEPQEQQAHQFIQINVSRLQEAVSLINAKSPVDRQEHTD